MESLPARQPRVPFDRAVWVGQLGANGRLRKVHAANLSRGGMFLRSREPLEVGQPVMVALDSSQEIVPLAHAEVVWTLAAIGFGIAFRELQPDAEALLELLLESGKVEAGKFAPGPARPPADALRHREPITPAIYAMTGRPAPLGPEPRTVLDAVPPVEPLDLKPPEVEKAGETRALWTGFNLPNRQRVKARVLSHELLLDFGSETVTRVVQKGNKVTLYFQSAARPV